MSAAGRTDLSPKTARILLVVIVAARLLLGFAYSAVNPLGEAPDEADHYAYVSHIARQGSLPVGTTMTQGKHPPLYYLVSAGVIKLLGANPDFTFLRSNPDGGVGAGAAAPNFFVHTTLEAWPWHDGALAMHVARLVSVLAGLILVLITYALGRTIWPDRYGEPLAAAALVAFLPETLFIGGSVSNDLLAAMWSTLALWLGLREGGRRTALAAGLSLGLAILTKASTTALALVVAGSMIVRDLTETRVDGDVAPGTLTRRGRRALTRLSITVLVTFLVIAPWLWRNWHLYRDLLGWQIVLRTIDLRQGPLTLSDLAWLARGWFLSFWGKFGAAGQMRLPWIFYGIWGSILVFGASGWVARRLRKDRDLPPATSRAAWVTLLGAPILTVLSIVCYSQVALGTDQGRLLFPAVAPIALLIIGGVAAWIPAGWTRWFPGFLFSGQGLLAALALVVGIVVPFAPPPPSSAADAATGEPVGARFDDKLELVAVHWETATSPVAISNDDTVGTTRLALYWRALAPTDQDLRAVLRLRDADGNLLWEAKRSPGAGRFSTDRWPAGRTIEDVFLIPSSALTAAKQLDLSLQPFPDGNWLPVAGVAEPLHLPMP